MSATLLTTLCREASRAIAARFSRQFSRQSVASAGYILEWLFDRGCPPGMCTKYGVDRSLAGCRAPNAQCNGSLEAFCSDNMVVACSVDGQPIVVDDCKSDPAEPPRYCITPNTGPAAVCSTVRP